MVTHCKSCLTLTDDDGKIVFELAQRRSKLIKVFVKKAVEEKWVLKRDLIFIIASVTQSPNLTAFLELKDKMESDEK